MAQKGKNRRLKVASAIILLAVPAIGLASVQATTPTAQLINVTNARDIKATPAAVSDDEARLRTFLDKDGGYKTKAGGYYNPKEGTYTDAEGGVADNWSGYTYTDGSYKSGLGDYYDAPTKTYKLADGRVAKVENLTAAQAIKALRDNVEANGGY